MFFGYARLLYSMYIRLRRPSFFAYENTGSESG